MKEILTTLFRRKRAALAFFLCMVAAPMLLTYILPAQYTGKATLLLTTGRFKKPFLPDEAGARTSYMQVSMEDVGSEVELLTSYPVLVKVVEINHLDSNVVPPRSKYLKFSVYLAKRIIHDFLVGIGLQPDVSPKDAAIDQLRRKVDVDFVKRTNIITVTWKGESPELARDVVNSLVDAYLVHHIRVHGNAYVLDAVQREKQLSEARLRGAQDSLNDYTKRYSISDVDSQRRLLMEKLGQAESKAQLLENAASRNLSPDVLGSLSEDPAIAELSKRLTDADMRRIELTTRYAGDDRKLVASNQEMEQLRSLITQRAERSLNTWKSLAATYQQQLSKLDRHKLEIDRLNEGIQDLSRIFQLNREKTDEILISQAMDRAAMAAARVVEYAVASSNPTFPKKIPMLIISVFFGLLFGSVYAIVLDKLSLRILSVVDVEQASHFPVLASIPEYAMHSEKEKTAVAASLSRNLIPASFGLLANPVSTNENLRPHTLLLASPSEGAGTSFLCDQLALAVSAAGGALVLSIGYDSQAMGQVDLLTACQPEFPLKKHLIASEDGRFQRLRLSTMPGQLSFYENPMGILLTSLGRLGVRHILIDTGSRRGDSLYLKFASLVDQIILVAAYDITSKPALGRMAEILLRHQGKIIGCIFNRRRDVIPEYIYQRLF